MKFKIIEKGKCFILPLKGFWISGIDMWDSLGLELTQEGESRPKFVIEIYMDFEMTRFNQTEKLAAYDNEAIKKMIDLIGLRIKKSEPTKTGDLYLTLDDGTEINVADAAYESWHITTIRQERIKNSWVIGGVGMTSFFEL